MGKINFGQLELDIDEYRNFLLGGKRGGYVYPTRSERVYVATELPPFFEMARIELEKLLSQIRPIGEPVVISDREQILHEFHLVSHGKTGTNKDGLLTGWSGDMPCPTYTKEKKEKKEVELGGIELAMAQAGIMPEDDESRKVIEQLGVRRIDLKSYYCRFVGDLPRQIGHVLLVTGDSALAAEIKDISQQISTEIKEKGNLYDINIYQRLIKLALENGFIPTPLLRAQFYGPMELMPEKLEDKADAIQKFVDKLVSKTMENLREANKESEINKNQIMAEAEALADALKYRKDLLLAHRENGGHFITENRFDLVNRLWYFYDVVSRYFVGVPVLAVTSSGCTDVSPSLWRYFGERGKFVIETPKTKERGRVLVAKIGEYDGRITYLNDPQRIEAIRDLSAERVAEQRKSSLDEKIREPTEGAVIPVELLRFERQQGPSKGVIYVPHSISEKDVFVSREPTFVLGDFGSGKSTGAFDLAVRLNSEGGYVAVFLTANEINRLLHNKLGQDPKQNDEVILKLLSGGVTSLPRSHREEQRFVFVIDAFDEITNYRENILHALRDPGQLREYGKVIVTSRFTGLNEYENPGFVTLHVDPQAVIRNIDRYLALRITDASGNKPDTVRVERFKEFLVRQDEGVRTNYLLVYFLTDIYNRRPQELGDLIGTVSEGEILIKGIELALWDHRLRKDQDMPQVPRSYEGQPQDEAEAKMQEYEAIRRGQLAPWMGLLKSVFSYMTTHNKTTITRPEIEQIVSSKWTLAQYVTELKRG